MGCLRVMSYLTPSRLPVGYSVTRQDMDRPQFDKSRLPKFDRIPDRKVGLVPLMFRFALHGRSVAVFTEGKGSQRFQGRVVILVNEHTASSSEMITAFAAENRLGTVVGSRTAGRLLGGNSFGSATVPYCVTSGRIPHLARCEVGRKGNRPGRDSAILARTAPRRFGYSATSRSGHIIEWRGSAD